MSKSLAELRASKATSLPERTYEVCLSQRLVAEVQALDAEATELKADSRRTDDEGEQAGPPKRSGEGAGGRLAEIEARKEEILAEMREHTGTIRLRGETAGDWRRWVSANPVREAGRDENNRPIFDTLDETLAYGFCNADALLDRLGDFVVAWNEEPLGTGDWDWLEERTPPGDLKVLAQLVVQMHEAAGVKAPKSRKVSSATPPNGTSSN